MLRQVDYVAGLSGHGLLYLGRHLFHAKMDASFVCPDPTNSVCCGHSVSQVNPSCRPVTLTVFGGRPHSGHASLGIESITYRALFFYLNKLNSRLKKPGALSRHV